MAAMVCFAENGVHPTTIQDICRRARLSAGAVYRYFNSKEEIVAAVAEAGQEMIEDTLREAAREADPIAVLDAMVVAFAALFDEAHPFYRRFGGKVTPETLRRMNLMLRAEALRNPQVMTILSANYARLQARVAEMVAAAQKSGRIPAGLDATSLAQSLNSHFIGLETQLAYNPELDVDAYVRTVRALLVSAGNGRGEAT